MKRKIFLSLRISFARKNNNLRNHSQKSKLPFSVFAKLKFCAILKLEFCAIPQFRKNQTVGDGVCFLEFNSSRAGRFCTKIRNRLTSKSLDNFSFVHAYFLKVDSSGIGYFLALFTRYCQVSHSHSLSYSYVNILLIFGINLQLFNSKLRISIFDNLPKNLHFAQKILPKTKISFHAQLSQKIFPLLHKLRKKIAQNSLRFMRKRFSHFVETLFLFFHDNILLLGRSICVK